MTDTIIVKDIVYEVFQDYKKPAMMIAMCNCDWKCAIEGCFDKTICQNSKIAKQKNIEKQKINCQLGSSTSRRK